MVSVNQGMRLLFQKNWRRGGEGGGGHMMFLVKRGTLNGGVEIFQGEGAGTMEDTMYTIES